ncbi:TPR repeat-containing protein [Thraustotheca clavata]|uniref:protein O-GlcNAc transferase n=1 Tax=Thraustotheca clavata TaxID=74557 RepID=A0A1W0AC99_9STRA|nr:TPR repeat-containing protein [Thraustotheca clavata]
MRWRMAALNALHMHDVLLERDNAALWLQSGTLLMRQENWSAAEVYFEHALNVGSLPERIGEMHCNVAEARRHQRKLDQKTLFHAITSVDDGSFDCTAVLAWIYIDLQDLNEAERILKQANVDRFGIVDAWLQIGQLYLDSLMWAKAAEAFKMAIQIAPQDTRAHIGMGKTMQLYGDFTAALNAYDSALLIDPFEFEAMFHQATIYHVQMGDMDNAITRYLSLLERKPENVAILNNLGAAMLNAKHRGQDHEAAAIFYRAISFDPNQMESYGNLKTYYAEQGNIEKAIEMLEKAYAVSGLDTFRIARVLLLPQVYTSAQHLLQTRTNMLAMLDAMLTDKTLHVDKVPPFYLTYQGMNDLPILRRLNKLFRQACPALTYTAQHVIQPIHEPSLCIRVGFMSKFFVDNHAHGLLLRGVLERLDRSKFCVYLIVIPDASLPVDQGLSKAVDHIVQLNLNHKSVQSDVAALKLDVLIFVDILSEPLSYFTSFARLAPVQALFWGNPTTSGNDNIDYFISGEYLEGNTEEEVYAEQVVLLSGLGIWYDPPPIPTVLGHRKDYGLQENWTIYLCAQSVFKLLPDFDQVLGSILSSDPNGHLVFVEARQRAWTLQFQDRLKRSFPISILQRIHFLPRVAGHEPYMRLLSMATIVLHPFPFGGSKTSAEALALGIPVVVMQTPYLRCRMAAAYYIHMGMSDCIASTQEDYINLAIRLGTNQTYRAMISSKIQARAPMLWQNQQVVDEWERFLINAVRLL